MSDTPKDPHGDHGHGHGDSPLMQLWVAMSGASAGHHEDTPGVDAKSSGVGHEPDQFDARTIVYVPIAVAITLVVTYLVVQGAFAFINGTESRQDVEVATTSTDPETVKKVEAENADKVKAWNDRAERLRAWSPEPLAQSTPSEKPLPAVPQPGLEYVRQVNLTRKDANGNIVTDPQFMRSVRPIGLNNSPEIYPEDLRPEEFVDPFTRQKLLSEPYWVNEGKTAIVPIEEMIHLVTHDPNWKGVLKVADKKADLHPGTLGKPKMSTGGVTPPLPTAVEKEDDHKH